MHATNEGPDGIVDGSDGGGTLRRFVACLHRDQAPADPRNLRRLARWVVAWALATVAQGGLGSIDPTSTPLAILGATLVLVAFGGTALALVRYLRRTDELNRRIQLLAVAVGSAAAVVLGVTAQTLDGLGAPMLDADAVVVVLLVVTALAQVGLSVRYR